MKAIQQHCKGANACNIGGVPKMPNLKGEGFETLLNRNVLEDHDESEKDADNDYDVDVNLSGGPTHMQQCIRFDDPLQQRLQQLEDMIAWILGVPRLMEKVTQNSYADSPFADPIVLIEVPKRFSVPTMKLYKAPRIETTMSLNTSRG